MILALVVIVVAIFTLSVCRAAGRGDRMEEEMDLREKSKLKEVK